MNTNLVKLSIILFIVSFKLNAFSQPQVAATTPRTIIVSDYNFADKGWEKSHVNLVNGTDVPDNNSKYISILLEPENNGSDFLFGNNGTVFLSRPVSKDPTLKNVRLRNNSFGGLMLSAISELKYSTYVKQCKNPANPVAPVLILQVDVDGNHTFDPNIDCSINFLPQFQSTLLPNGNRIPAVVMNTWQEWDALKGKWRFAPGTKVIPEFGKDGKLFDLTTFLDFYKPNEVAIINTDYSTANGGGGIRVTVPGMPGVTEYDDFEGYFDGFILSTTGGLSQAYDFQYTYTGFSYRKAFIVTIIFLVLATSLFILYKRRRAGVKVK